MRAGTRPVEGRLAQNGEIIEYRGNTPSIPYSVSIERSDSVSNSNTNTNTNTNTNNEPPSQKAKKGMGRLEC